jgi:tetratricopeptide (TPR) repeat protein
MKVLLCLLFVGFLFASCTPKAKKIEAYLKDGIEKNMHGDYNKAIEDFSNVIDLDADNYTAYYNRANAKFNLKPRGAKGALIDYNKAIELKPDYADAFYNRGFCRQYLDDQNGACNDWDKAGALGKSNVKDMLNYCR